MFIKRQMLHLDLSLSHKSLTRVLSLSHVLGSSQSWPPRRILILSAIIQSHLHVLCVRRGHKNRTQSCMRPRNSPAKNYTCNNKPRALLKRAPKMFSLGPSSVKISSLSLSLFPSSNSRKGWVSENLIITLSAPLCDAAEREKAAAACNPSDKYFLS